MKMKRRCYGIKMFKLCLVNGYTHNLSIYSGRTLDNGRNFSEKVVIDLCERFNIFCVLITDTPVYL